MNILTYKRYELKIEQIFQDFMTEKLVVDTRYQRRSVWLERDKVRLIETILLNLIIPEIFFWDADTDPESGKTVTHIVDGQQRVNAIVQFINNEFKLSKDSLIDQEMKERFGDKYFSDLDPVDKITVWRYSLSIVNIITDNLDEIRILFYRLNLTDYSLNDQEKRHSNMWGRFADLTQELSNHPFWDEYRVFNSGDIKRMKDVEFCASLILLARKGIINQTDQKPLNEAYQDYAVEYPEYEQDKHTILHWFDLFKDFYSEENYSFIRKRTQLYTVFCLISYIAYSDIIITNQMVNKFNEFVRRYNEFENTSENIIVPDDDPIKKYKLASSEGISKLSNRKIRFDVLRDYVLS